MENGYGEDGDWWCTRAVAEKWERVGGGVGRGLSSKAAWLSGCGCAQRVAERQSEGKMRGSSVARATAVVGTIVRWSSGLDGGGVGEVKLVARDLVLSACRRGGLDWRGGVRIEVS